MDKQKLADVLNQANAMEKYVWLKHKFDRKPIRFLGQLRSDGSIRVGIYLSFIDDHEGRMDIMPEDVEWAHISLQTTESAICNRLDSSMESETLIRIWFSDFLPKTLFKFLFYSPCHKSTERKLQLIGHFVTDETFKCASERSTISIDVLNDVQNTSIPISSVSNCDNFFDFCDEPHFKFFAESAT